MLKKRLRNYRSAEDCGQWNEILINDFEEDIAFRSVIGSLHEDAVATQFLDQPVPDASPHICGIELDLGKQISIAYSLSYLSPVYFHVPAQITLSLERIGSAGGTIEYTCGLVDHDGNMSTFRGPVLPSDAREWAIRECCQFTGRTLDEWRRNNRASG